MYRTTITDNTKSQGPFRSSLPVKKGRGATVIPSRKRGYKTFSLGDYLQKRGTIICLAALFVLGLGCGRFFVTRLPESLGVDLQILIDGFVSGRGDGNLVQTFWTAFSSNFVLFLILFFCAFCLVGMPIIYFVPFYKGLGVGLAVGAIFHLYGVQAIWYVLGLILPGTFLSCMLIIALSNNALQLSSALYKAVVQKSGEDISTKPRAVCIKFLAYVVILMLSSCMEGILFYLFGSTLALI